MKVRDILSRRPLVSAHEDDNLEKAAWAMLSAGVHHLPIFDSQAQIVGVLDERDILMRRAAAGHAADLEPVKSAMTSTAVTISADEDFQNAAHHMLNHGVSALIVFDAGRAIGMLTLTDLVHHSLAPEPRAAAVSPSVRDVMQRAPITAAADDLLIDALSRMADRNVRHLPVISGDGKVIGIVSDRDIRTAIGDPDRAIEIETTRVRLQSLRISDIMSRPAVTVGVAMPLAEAAARFVEHRVGALPVVDEGGRLVGIVSYVDLLRAATFPQKAPQAKRA